MDWIESGRAWGERAAVWTYLIEPYLAVRALGAAGPPACSSRGYDRFAAALRKAIRPLWTEGVGVRIVSEFGWILGRVPG